MAVHHIKRGLNLPISGAPSDRLDDAGQVSRVAVVADDFPLMKPRMHVVVGDKVKRGQLLFEDRKAEGVRFTSPAEGEVIAVNRGERRVLQSVVIALSASEQSGQGEQVEFAGYLGSNVSDYDRESLKKLLAESGLWAGIRARPYDRVPSPSEDCQSIFVTAMDTNPLAGSVLRALEGREADFVTGLKALQLLTDGKVYLCKEAGAAVPTDSGVHEAEFAGIHPAGLVGTHIHTLEPVGRKRTAWHIGYQEVAAVGALLSTGKLDLTRVVALGGPLVNEPRLIRTRQGAYVPELVDGQLKEDSKARLVAGSVLNGRTANCELWGYLGRYHNQVSVLEDDNERVLFGWLQSEKKQYSVTGAFFPIAILGFAGLLGLLLALPTLPGPWPVHMVHYALTVAMAGVVCFYVSLMAYRALAGAEGAKDIDMTTTTHGSHRAMVPIGSFERVVPLDIMPTFLLRALAVDDVETAENLGCLELVEEDLALCTFVATGKTDFGEALRRNLDIIWKEG